MGVGVVYMTASSGLLGSGIYTSFISRRRGEGAFVSHSIGSMASKNNVGLSIVIISGKSISETQSYAPCYS